MRTAPVRRSRSASAYTRRIRNTDRVWRHYGSTDPYYGVLTADAFRADAITDELRQHFFEIGSRFIADMLEEVRRCLDPEFSPSRALDFGCGVGRLTIPLSRVCAEVVGVDISDAMLEEARRNCVKEHVTNATFAKSDDDLSSVSGSFDLLNSFIVFQHIDPRRGERVLSRAVARLRDGGIGMAHFTYSFPSTTPRWRRTLLWGYHRVPLLWSARNLVKRRPFREPMMHMNQYDMSALLRVLQESGCHRVRVKFTETGFFGEPFYGAILMFQKTREDTTRYG